MNNYNNTIIDLSKVAEKEYWDAVHAMEYLNMYDKDNYFKNRWFSKATDDSTCKDLLDFLRKETSNSNSNNSNPMTIPMVCSNKAVMLKPNRYISRVYGGFVIYKYESERPEYTDCGFDFDAEQAFLEAKDPSLVALHSAAYFFTCGTNFREVHRLWNQLYKNNQCGMTNVLGAFDRDYFSKAFYQDCGPAHDVLYTCPIVHNNGMYGTINICKTHITLETANTLRWNYRLKSMNRRVRALETKAAIMMLLFISGFNYSDGNLAFYNAPCGITQFTLEASNSCDTLDDIVTRTMLFYQLNTGTDWLDANTELRSDSLSKESIEDLSQYNPPVHYGPVKSLRKEELNQLESLADDVCGKKNHK